MRHAYARSTWRKLPALSGGVSAQPLNIMLLRRFPFIVFLLVVACGRVVAAPAPTFDQWVDTFTTEWARTNPQFATQAQYFSGAEQDALDRQLTMVGPWGNTFGRAATEARAALARRGLEELKRIPTANLTAAQRTSAALVAWFLKNTIDSAEFAAHRAVFDQFAGLQVGLVNFLTQTHPIRNRRDAENYLVRLALVAPRIDEGIAEARAAAAAGILSPRFIVERTLEQIDGFLLHPARENVFTASFDTRMGALGAAIAPEVRKSSVAAAEKIVAEAVIPAYRRVRALLAEQLPKTTGDAGVWRLPRGAESYRQALATYTTTSLGADEIHAIGLREVARLEGEMDKILRSLGYNEGSVKDRTAALEAASQPPATPDPRAMLLADNERYVADALQRCEALFDLRPRSPVVVKREPPFSERTAAAHYTPPAPDGSKPGTYWLPLPGPTFELIRMRSLAYHEAVPGHHFQVALQQESTELPRFRKLGAFGFISAYGEGWGLYAERLADESGWYDGDPRGRLGALGMQLFRARRLVVDTGMHAKRWTRQQAIDYGIPATEVERYIVWPGQACSYMIGQLRIVELREKARSALGGKFSIKGFHNVVLSTGSVPLDVLAQEVDAWVAAQR